VKLSTAILRGIKLDGPKVRKLLFKLRLDGQIAACCALGAAALGVSKRKVELLRRKAVEAAKEMHEETGRKRMTKHCREKAQEMLEGFVSGEILSRFSTFDKADVIGWNDDDGWSRERIAAFLKKQGK
jgi:hypothetical protein